MVEGSNNTTVTVGAWGIALATLLLWIFETGSGIVVPIAIQGAFTIFITGSMQWFLPVEAE